MKLAENPDTLSATEVRALKTCAGRGSMPAYISHVGIFAADGLAVWCTTDGHRLAMVAKPTDPSQPARALVFPIGARQKGAVYNHGAVVACGEIMPIDGLKFPKIHKLFPPALVAKVGGKHAVLDPNILSGIFPAGLLPEHFAAIEASATDLVIVWTEDLPNIWVLVMPVRHDAGGKHEEHLPVLSAIAATFGEKI